jgi:hypothetical protein
VIANLSYVFSSSVFQPRGGIVDWRYETEVVPPCHPHVPFPSVVGSFSPAAYPHTAICLDHLFDAQRAASLYLVSAANYILHPHEGLICGARLLEGLSFDGDLVGSSQLARRDAHGAAGDDEACHVPASLGRAPSGSRSSSRRVSSRT